MNTMNENAQAMTLTEAVTTMASAIQELVALAKAESSVTTATTTEVTTTAETTATEATETTTTTTTPIVVIDDDDNVIATTATETTTATTATETTTATADEEDNTEFKGSMIEQDPMDPMPSAETADTAAEETAAVTAAEETLDNIICDISTLYDVAEFALCHEGKNIDSDHSPYAPKENVTGMIGDFRISISKEILKETNMVTGTFRMIVRDKCISTPLMDHEIRIINDHVEVRTSDNTTMSRVDKMKEDHDLMRFLEITDEVSSLVMSKYISK